jgi:adenylate kinase
MDVEKLAELWQHPEELTLIDGHLAHHVPVDALVVVRCHPDELRKRLSQRGYSAGKIQANVEVEMLGGPWNELIGDSRPIFEGADVQGWIEDGCPHHTTPDSAIDWLSLP